jgi:hypothetical protein
MTLQWNPYVAVRVDSDAGGDGIKRGAIMSLEEDLLKIEEKFWTGGPEAYQQHADEKCLVAFSDKMAGVMSKDDIAKSAEKGRWKDVSMTQKGLAKLSDSAVVITYECNAKRKDGKPHHALVSSGYVNRGQGWKLAFHQQTALEAA